MELQYRSYCQCSFASYSQLVFYSTDSSIAFVHLCRNKPLPPSPIRLHPQSAHKHIQTCTDIQYTHHFSVYCWEAERNTHTHTHTHILTIDVLETLCSSTRNMPSYLPPLPLSRTLPRSLMHIYTLLCEPNNVRQALLSCDRA